MVEVEFPTGDTVSAAIEWFKIWPRVADEKELSIHASAVLGRPPFAVLMASCACERHERGLATQIEIDGQWQSWASIRGVEPPHKLDSVRERPHTLLLAYPYDFASARRGADMVADALLAHAPSISPSVVRMVRFVFEELGANVVQHSSAPLTGVGWADLHADGKRFALGFSDRGVGIRASLQRNPELAGRIADDGEALQLALSARISGAGPTRGNMGWGLKALVDLSDLLNAELQFTSGTAMLTRRTSAGQRMNVIRAIPAWQGCWIAVEATLA